MAKTRPPAGKGGTARSGTAASGRDREASLGTNRVDRILGGIFVGVMGISVVTFFVLMVGAGTGFLNDSNTTLYALVLAIPFIGLPLAIVLIIVLTVRMASERRRANRPD